MFGFGNKRATFDARIKSILTSYLHIDINHSTNKKFDGYLPFMNMLDHAWKNKIDPETTAISIALAYFGGVVQTNMTQTTKNEMIELRSNMKKFLGDKSYNVNLTADVKKHISDNLSNLSKKNTGLDYQSGPKNNKTTKTEFSKSPKYTKRDNAKKVIWAKSTKEKPSKSKVAPQKIYNEAEIRWLREQWESLQRKRAKGKKLDDYEKRLEDQYKISIKQKSAE